jgi:hypothetical protein
LRREGVEKDGAITQLQIEITELNNEMDDLKEENYANLSVINRLKAAQLSCHLLFLCFTSRTTRSLSSHYYLLLS